MTSPLLKMEMTRRRKRKTRTITLVKLEQLLNETKSSSALVLQLQKYYQQWQEMIIQQNPLDDNATHTFLKIFAKCFSSQIHIHIQQQLVNGIINSNFLNIHLVQFISKTFTSTECPDRIDKLCSIVNFLEVLQKYEDGNFKVLPIVNLCSTRINLDIENEYEIDYNLKQRFDCIQQHHRQCKNYSSDISTPDFLDDYKHVPILPTASELTNQEFDKNIATFDRFNEFSDYLSRQFFILRNDLMAPMKSVIRNFMENIGGKSRNSNVYQHVQLKSPVQTRGGKIVYELQFDVGPFKDVDWEHSRKLIHGSLLCITADNFKAVTYAVVHSSDQVNQGIISVRFINDEGEETDHNQLERLNTTYAMIESPVFYEMYYSVLKGLQSQVLTNQYYLIDTEPYIRVPIYLKQKPNFDLSCLSTGTEENCNKLKNVNVENFFQWPETILNPKQKLALHKALTSSVSLIRTPPGTGKSFMCLKIVQTLLQNISETCKKPILVVFPKDKSLDKFLENLSPEQNIVRIGGITQNKSAKRYSINKAVKFAMSKASYVQSLRHFIKNIRQMRKQLFELEMYRYYMTFYVLNESVLQDLPNSDNHLLKIISTTFLCEDNSAIFSWLGLSPEDVTCTYPSDVDHLEDNVNLQEEHENSNEKLAVFKQEYEDAEKELQESVYDTEDTNISSEISHRKLDISYKQIHSEMKTGFNEHDSMNHLKVESMNNPFYMCKLEEYCHVKLEDITDKTVNERIGYIHKHYEEIRSRCQQNQMLCMQELHKTDVLPLDRPRPQEVSTMNLLDKWKLYRRWIQTKENLLNENIKELKEKYEKANRRYLELISEIELDVLHSAKVIAVTVNGAAKFQPILREIGCKFIILQDAPQMLESQIAILLTPKTESLILIGDHQQLGSPTPSTDSCLKETNLDVSLFNKLDKNKIPSTTLNRQYRMRPEISNLCKQVYPEIVDDQSVNRMLKVVGMKHNVFFVSHKNKEQFIPSARSFVNTFEAKFVVFLCKYLLQQGYKSHHITILTPYYSQVLEIQQRMCKNYAFKNIVVTSFDHYQGEHCDIILLSLVQCEVSFLPDENSITTALSRGALGIYAFGDFDYLSKSSPFWHAILSSMKFKKTVGSSLPLVCRQHSKSLTMIKKSNDFVTLVPNGQCRAYCNAVLECGHICGKIGHTGTHGSCNKPCEKVCKGGHPCTKLCRDPCPRCVVEVEKILSCGHDKTMQCYADPVDEDCEEKIIYKFEKCGHVEEILCHEYNTPRVCSIDCDYRLYCGHRCHLKCHTTMDDDHDDPQCVKLCNKTITCALGHVYKCEHSCIDECNPCSAMTSKKLTCGHSVTIECYRLAETLNCFKICHKTLPCGHDCEKKCGEPCECTTLVERDLPCNHIISIECRFKDSIGRVNGKKSAYFIKNRMIKKQTVCTLPCLEFMSCGHACRNRCNEPCSTQCPLTLFRKQNCGHEVEVSCSNITGHPDLINKNCRKTCNETLPCSHQCRGTCGSCFQGRVHVPCSEKCGRVLICGHVCDISCSEACPPCTKKCPNRCTHSRCPSVCGKPCQQCVETCEWACPHYQCTKLCSEECDREPCNVPCPKKLKCGHPCIGLCGEVCPPLCRICNSETLSEFHILHIEEEKDARFIFLEDCGHCIEVTALDQWMNQTINNEIGMKCCPRCKTIVWRCQRYGNVIRQCLNEVQQVKQKIFGNIINLRETKVQLHRRLISEQLIQKHFHKEYNVIDSALTQKKTLHYNAYNAIENQILILQSLAKLLESRNVELHGDYHTRHTKPLVARLMMQEFQISSRELEAIAQECRRIKLNTEMITIDKRYSQYSYKAEKEEFTRIRAILHSGQTLDEEDEIYANVVFTDWLATIPGLDITEKERLQIIKAVDVGKKGQWFKCPNGHPYAIGECGGAMQLSKCPDCGAVVGGTNHVLSAGNVHAGEMDGSIYPRYSELTNLNNFDPREFHERLSIKLKTYT